MDRSARARDKSLEFALGDAWSLLQRWDPSGSTQMFSFGSTSFTVSKVWDVGRAWQPELYCCQGGGKTFFSSLY